jgi:hypothetical protein
MIAESLGLAVTYHPMGFGDGDSQAGWFRIHCLRGCHGATRIDATKMDPITRSHFNAWISTVMTDHDKADIEGS